MRIFREKVCALSALPKAPASKPRRVIRFNMVADFISPDIGKMTIPRYNKEFASNNASRQQSILSV
jgi:hypothetical protein